MTKGSVEERLAAIEARNARVEKNKAWETSLTRRLSIALLTYLVVLAYLLLIDNDRPYVTAIVPAVGYFLSTLVMRNIKSLWQGRRR
ncbi:TPA: hypothetical protein DIS56_02535 [Candidatus Saccharibacteria bacterium]|nr:MAG: hypothetical protein A3F05_03685 [Candidatus Saccharibacteria bacterium RIFCSPHIGHO2_12_FULL_47_17]HCM51987.1 hypothetical protein [Candidatus Saccharibacteria bacterium]